MKRRAFISFMLLTTLITGLCACNDSQKMPDPNDVKIQTPQALVQSDVPEAYQEPIAKLLSGWEVREGSLSDPLIGTRLLMYDNTTKTIKSKDEIGYMIIDLDGNGINELITAPIAGFTENALVYDILTIDESGKVFHLANSLEATYHLMADNSFILRTPKADKSGYSFKRVTVNGTERPTEVEITKEESAKYYISTAELTPFSTLEK